MIVLGLIRLLTGIAALLWRKSAVSPQKQWPPVVGDQVEMLGRYSMGRYPAVVTAWAPGTNGWPLISVRIMGNGAIDENVQAWEIRPMQRLAAAARAHPDYSPAAYDNDNVKHLLSCGGCPECKGVGEYYRKCKHGTLLHRTDARTLCWKCWRSATKTPRA